MGLNAVVEVSSGVEQSQRGPGRAARASRGRALSIGALKTRRSFPGQ